MITKIAALFAAAIFSCQVLAADLIIHNANVRTLDDRFPRASSIAMKAGRIVAVGDRTAVERIATDSTRWIDARGRLIIPGFNDAHVHFHGVGNWFSHLDLRDERTADGILRRIEDAAEVIPIGRWILGSGIATRSVPLSALPSIRTLDRVSPEHPLLIYIDGYSNAIVNSAAMRIADIKLDDERTLKNRSDEPLAVISGNSLDRARRNIPSNYGIDLPAIIQAATNHAARLGVTSVQDVHSDDLFTILNELDRSGRLKTRVYDCIGIADQKRPADADITAAIGTGTIRRGCVKADTVETADQIPQLAAKFADADKRGLQIMVHAIGRRDVATTLTAFEALVERNGKRDRRIRVEHAYGIAAADRERAKRVDAILSMQPFLFWRGENAVSDDLRALVTTGVKLAFGSDASMVSLDPLLGIHAAVNSGSGSITVDDAVRRYTIGSAYAEFQENEKGTIAIGKYADLVMLSDDIFAIDRRRIRDAKTVMTIMNGRVVYYDKKMFDNLN